MHQREFWGLKAPLVVSKDPEICLFDIPKEHFRLVCKLPVGSVLHLEFFFWQILNFSLSYWLGDAMLSFNLEESYSTIFCLVEVRAGAHWRVHCWVSDDIAGNLIMFTPRCVHLLFAEGLLALVWNSSQFHMLEVLPFSSSCLSRYYFLFFLLDICPCSWNCTVRRGKLHLCSCILFQGMAKGNSPNR